MKVSSTWILLVCSLVVAPSVAVAEQPPPALELRVVNGDEAVVSWRGELRASTAVEASLLLPAGRLVQLRLEPFSVVGESARFVIGRVEGSDLPYAFDPTRVALYRGVAEGHAESRVFLALSAYGARGYVDLGGPDTRYSVTTSEPAGGAPVPSMPPYLPACGTVSAGDGRAAQSSVQEPAQALRTHGVLRGLRQIEIAVETDHEFFQLFGDVDAAMAYVVTLYAQLSDIYIREVDTRVELSFVRIWDDPNDLFNDVDPSPLGDFRSYWNSNMGAVQRDVAQLISGRRDYPFGGQAYLNALCGSSAYSVVGYMLGFFPDPSTSSPYHYDLAVTAHELGHNSGTRHTHDSPNNIDTCDDPGTTAQRGTIMSYCGQTWSGGNGNRELYFHSVIRQNMDSFISGASCIADDCNGNGIADDQDIAAGTSQDSDSNGVPDECEDCNGNLVLDDADISASTSSDVNGNDIPDECEPDCDGSGIPDDVEIADSTYTDAHGNGVPDPCELDCDSDGTSDYTEIQADMPLDVDRDAALDACRDCDSNGSADVDALGGAHNLWVASGIPSQPIREFYSSSGVLTRLSSGGAPIAEGQDLIVTPGGRVLVTSGADDRVVEFDLAGSHVEDLIPSTGQLDHPTGLLLLPGGDLLVANRGSSRILRYDPAGAFLGAFVNAGSGGLVSPFGLTLGPNGNLFATSSTNEILEYDGVTGVFVAAFVTATDNGGLDQPRGLVFKPDGNLLVASFGTDEVLEFEAVTGSPLGKWAQVGTATRLTQVSPWGIRIGPNGNVFVVRTGEDYGSGAASAGTDHEDHDDHDEELEDAIKAGLHLSNAQIYEFDVRNGNFLRTYVGGNDHGLLFPTGFDFVPGWVEDCNLTLLPDACDIASGASLDSNVNSVPDECEIDCNSNGILDRNDVIPFGTSPDCNYNLTPDDCDLSSGLSVDCNANATPDECEATVTPGPVADVAGLLLARVGAATSIDWDLDSPAAGYDVAGGTLSALLSDGGILGADCLADDLSSPSWVDPRPDPVAGQGNYYVVRVQSVCGTGGYGSDSDGGTRAPAVDCP